jgi:predicted RNase H-like HicB family nuclease
VRRNGPSVCAIRNAMQDGISTNCENLSALATGRRKGEDLSSSPSAQGVAKERPDMNNKFEVVVYWSEQDGHFLAEVPELPSIITDGATRAEALRNAEEMIDAYLKAAHEASWPIPQPKGRLAFA